MSLLRCLVVAMVLGQGTASAVAHEFKVGDLEIRHPWAKATPGTSRRAAVYMVIVNHGSLPDRLVAVASPMATRSEIHVHSLENGIASIGRLDTLEVPTGGIKLATEGPHVMLFGLGEALVAERTFALTLTFERAGSVTVQVYVEEAGATTSVDEEPGS